MKCLRAGVAVVLATIVTGCTNHATGTLAPTTSNGPSASGASLLIGGSTTISSGSRTQLRAVVLLADGTEQDLTANAVWSGDAPSVVADGGSGSITGMASERAEA